MNVALEIVRSWAEVDGNVSTTASLLDWIGALNEATHVRVDQTSVGDDSFWFYDDYAGEILNRKRSFFSIKGIRQFEGSRFVSEQPIILQPEIGYLGIACAMIDGVLNFLMQAKIEPGNVNCVQISPTIQATKSNFLRAHGGELPAFFGLFESAGRDHTVLYDQIQSEQGARFFRKRNRNMIVLLDRPVAAPPTFRWMTLGQIKALMREPNLVNMDTRTVLSGLPLAGLAAPAERGEAKALFSDDALFRSILAVPAADAESDPARLSCVFSPLNDLKMTRDLRRVIVPLNELAGWSVSDCGVDSLAPADFCVRYYDIEISGREVARWTQPLLKANGDATFALATRVSGGIRQFLVRATEEIGIFDKVELGPSVQWEFTHDHDHHNEVEAAVASLLTGGADTLADVILSEEGGRFYHEQNRNVIVEVPAGTLDQPPPGYVWTDYATLGQAIQFGGLVNIQLRNLLSLLPL